jgi:anti-anti-sigma factor
MVRYEIENSIMEEPRLVCNFTDRLDTANCQKIEEELYGKVCATKIPVTFNLEGVDYVSSAFLRICLRVVKQTGPENFSAINTTPNVKKVFKIAGFDKQINIS